ncbi:hypothetical protein VTO73DRAFT_46 [Trametes versicolor]
MCTATSCMQLDVYCNVRVLDIPRAKIFILDANLETRTAKHSQTYQGTSPHRPQRFAERTTAAYKNGPPRLSAPTAKSAPIAPTAAPHRPTTPQTSAPFPRRTSPKLARPAHPMRPTRPTHTSHPGRPAGLPRAQIAPSGSLPTTATPADRTARAHAVSRRSEQKIYWRSRAISLHRARRGAQSPRPGRPSRPLPAILGRDVPGDGLRRVPARAGAHGVFQFRTFGGGRGGGAGMGGSRRRSVGLASAIRGDGYPWSTDTTLAMRWRRLGTQDALDNVRGPLAAADRRTACAPASHPGCAQPRRRAPVHRGACPLRFAGLYGQNENGQFGTISWVGADGRRKKARTELATHPPALELGIAGPGHVSRRGPSRRGA